MDEPDDPLALLTKLYRDETLPAALRLSAAKAAAPYHHRRDGEAETVVLKVDIRLDSP